MRRAATDMIVIQANRAEQQHRHNAQAIVYFDGACPLCTAEIKPLQVARRWAISCVSSMPHRRMRRLARDLDADAAMRRFHVRLVRWHAGIGRARLCRDLANTAGLALGGTDLPRYLA